MRLSIALGCMQILKEGAANNDMTAFGLTQSDFDLLTSDQMWTSEDRVQVKNCLEAVQYGVLTMQGVPPIELCAEYIAASIFMFVSPINYMAACAWSHRTRSVDEASKREFDPVTPGELHNFLVRMHDADGAEDFKWKFEKSTAAAAARSVKDKEVKDA